MNTFCSRWCFIKIAKEASMRLGEEKSPNSKFCSIQPNVCDSDQRTSVRAHFPFDLVYFLCSATSAGHVAPARLQLLCSTAMMRLVASTGYGCLPGTSKALLQLTTDPPWLWEAAAPPAFHRWGKEARPPAQGRRLLVEEQSLGPRSVCLQSLCSCSPTTHSVTRPPFVLFTKIFFSSTEVRMSGFKMPAIWLRRKDG